MIFDYMSWSIPRPNKAQLIAILNAISTFTFKSLLDLGVPVAVSDGVALVAGVATCVVGTVFLFQLSPLHADSELGGIVRVVVEKPKSAAESYSSRMITKVRMRVYYHNN